MSQLSINGLSKTLWPLVVELIR